MTPEIDKQFREDSLRLLMNRFEANSYHSYSFEKDFGERVLNDLLDDQVDWRMYYGDVEIGGATAHGAFIYYSESQAFVNEHAVDFLQLLKDSMAENLDVAEALMEDMPDSLARGAYEIYLDRLDNFFQGVDVREFLDETLAQMRKEDVLELMSAEFESEMVLGIGGYVDVDAYKSFERVTFTIGECDGSAEYSGDLCDVLSCATEYVC